MRFSKLEMLKGLQDAAAALNRFSSRQRANRGLIIYAQGKNTQAQADFDKAKQLGYARPIVTAEYRYP